MNGTGNCEDISAKSVPAKEAESKWQPIATAPKDGTLLLLFCDHRDGDPEWGIGHWVLPIGRPGPFGPYAWKLQNDGGLVAERIVTHWQRLTAPAVQS